MEQFTSIHEMKQWVQKQKEQGKKIGFVPTMGYLHEGHLSLMEKAKAENDLVVASIFVNPLQFGEGEDFDRYPKDEKRDFQLAKDVGVNVLFTPTVDEMYPKPMSATFVVHEGVDVLCGASRPGHFDGVVTVVMKLFGIVSPDRAYFGLKDAQQLAVLENLVRDYHLDIEIVRGPIIREDDGLAKSSRNVNLTEVEREEAKNIFQALTEIASIIKTRGETSVSELENYLHSLLEDNLTATVDYAEIRTFPALDKPVDLAHVTGEIIIAVAVRYSKVRLIDNIILNVQDD